MCCGRCPRRGVEGSGSTRSDEFRGSSFGRVVFRGVAEDAGGPRGSQRLGEGLVQLAVFLFEPLGALGSDLKPAQQGSGRGALTVGGAWCWRRRTMAFAEPADLCSKVVLGVQPGSGHSGLAGDGLEGDRRARGVQAAQCPPCLTAGSFGSTSCSHDEVLSLIHISEPTRRTPISYAVFCLKKKKKHL